MIIVNITASFPQLKGKNIFHGRGEGSRWPVAAGRALDQIARQTKNKRFSTVTASITVRKEDTAQEIEQKREKEMQEYLSPKHVHLSPDTICSYCGHRAAEHHENGACRHNNGSPCDCKALRASCTRCGNERRVTSLDEKGYCKDCTNSPSFN